MEPVPQQVSARLATRSARMGAPALDSRVWRGEGGFFRPPTPLRTNCEGRNTDHRRDWASPRPRPRACRTASPQTPQSAHHATTLQHRASPRNGSPTPASTYPPPHPPPTPAVTTAQPLQQSEVQEPAVDHRAAWAKWVQPFEEQPTQKSGARLEVGSAADTDMQGEGAPMSPTAPGSLTPAPFSSLASDTAAEKADDPKPIETPSPVQAPLAFYSPAASTQRRCAVRL